MRNVEIHSCPELMDLIQEVGFLPLLDSGIRGYSAEDVVDEDNRYGLAVVEVEGTYRH